jgi:hypothetical protein
VLAVLVAATLQAAPPQDATTCISPADGLVPNRPFRELSGLAWDPALQLAIGVRDERRDYPGYEIFAFDPEMVGADGCHTALPLMSDSLSARFQLEDLEGVTRTDDGVYYALTSLSLDRLPSALRDGWTRFQGVRFTVGRSGGRPAVDSMGRLSANRRPDLREWVISSSGRDWTANAYRGRAESGGINVEGLSWNSDGSLMVGFRAPMDPGPSAPVLTLRVPAPDSQPQAIGWSAIDVARLPASNKEEQQRGIRAMARVPGAGTPERYVVVVGHTGPRHDNLRLVLWEPSSGAVLDRGVLPDGFVGEGIAMVDIRDNRLDVLLVDDLRGDALRLWIDGWQ